jgi:hypothetical protein
VYFSPGASSSPDSKVAPCVSGSGKDLFFLDYREKKILRGAPSAYPAKI